MDADPTDTAQLGAAHQVSLPAGAGSPARPWSSVGLLCFRFALLYFLLYTHPFPLEHVPQPSEIASIFDAEWPYEQQTAPFYEALDEYQADVARTELRAVDFVAQSIFGFEHTLDRPLGSGDPTFSYVHLALLLALAGLGALLWSILADWLDRRGRCERFAAPWLHLGARYWLAFALLSYGFAKVFPGQFRPPSLARLVSVYGDSSPMSVLWTFMGTSPAYTVFAGVAELAAGLLLLFRRTATLGALIGAAVMLNVVALNFCYDVPVKLYSLHLFLVAALLCSPDLGRLWRVLVSNRPALPRDLTRPRMPYFGHLLRLVIVGPYLFTSVSDVIERYKTPVEPPPLYGIWDVVNHKEDGVALAPLTTDPRRWNALLVENGRASSWQAMDGSLRTLALAHDAVAETLTLSTSATWAYSLEGDALTLRGEFSRWFRPDSSPAAAGAGDAKPDPGDPRDPQVELVLARADAQPAVVVADPSAAPEPRAEVAADAAVPAGPVVPEALIGRWRVSRNAVIGQVATRRRADPTGFEAVTFGDDGSAVVEHAGGVTARYTLTVDAERRRMTLGASDALRVSQRADGALELSGTFRGHEVALELARRDLRSFLLVRRGFHWINEIPLNRF